MHWFLNHPTLILHISRFLLQWCSICTASAYVFLLFEKQCFQQNKCNLKVWKLYFRFVVVKKHGIFPCFFPGRQKCTYRYAFYSTVHVHALAQIKFKTFETLHAEISLAKYIEEIENYNYFLINIFLNILPGCTRFFTFQVFVHIK